MFLSSSFVASKEYVNVQVLTHFLNLRKGASGFWDALSSSSSSPFISFFFWKKTVLHCGTKMFIGTANGKCLSITNLRKYRTVTNHCRITPIIIIQCMRKKTELPGTVSLCELRTGCWMRRNSKRGEIYRWLSIDLSIDYFILSFANVYQCESDIQLGVDTMYSSFIIYQTGTTISFK